MTRAETSELGKPPSSSKTSGPTAPPTRDLTDTDLARARLALYFDQARGLQPAPHQVRVMRAVQAFLKQCWSKPPAEHQAFRVLNINLPPGAGKSSIISATLPPWVLGHRPTERIMIVSAKGDLAEMFEVVTKADIEAGDVYRACFPSSDARPDKTRGWGRGRLYVQGHPRGEITPSITANGLFGSILGKRATLVILDDPQDQETARTPGMREKVWEFIVGTVLSRAIPGSPIINVQQRLHEEDISGLLQRHFNADTLSIPAIDENGSSYWPERYSVPYLQQLRRANPHLFESWYQQKPGGGEGDIFKREWLTSHYHDGPPAGQRIQSWDTAFKTGQENDYSAYVEATITPTLDVYVTDFDWQRLEFPELTEAMTTLGHRQPHLVLVEDKASGTSAVQALKRQTSLPIEAVKPEGDKVSRARGVTGWMEAGKVHLPRNHPRLAEFEAFLTGFPLLAHDDPVDAFTQLLAYVIAREKPKRAPERRSTVRVNSR